MEDNNKWFAQSVARFTVVIENAIHADKDGLSLNMSESVESVENLFLQGFHLFTAERDWKQQLANGLNLFTTPCT